MKENKSETLLSEIKSENNKKNISSLEISKEAKINNKNFTINILTFLYFFILLFSITIFTNLEDGAIIASLSKIKEEYSIKNNVLGLIGTSNIFGIFIGSVLYFSSSTIHKKNKKSTLLLILLIKFLSLIISLYSTNYILFLVLRFISGLSQSFIIIYFPIWVDQFAGGDSNQKIFAIAIMQFGSPIGLIFGFTITTFTYFKVIIILI